ncbi:MAG: TRC40/GET3/ArsA family transport-energizing ATPase [Phycisphaerales bacterium]
MRILLFVGKGGVGKSTMACATAVRTASLGYRTIVLSADPAHSVSDVLRASKRSLSPGGTGLSPVADNLWMQELSINDELKNRWSSITAFWSKFFRDMDLSDILADELAILPGMEEMAVLLTLADYHREETYDVAIVDCAPSAESLRFISVPKTIDWYVRKLFRIQRTASKLLRPMQKFGAKVPVPEDEYFDEVKDVNDRLSGVDDLLTDPEITSVRIVTLPEKIVLQETRRVLLHLSLYGLSVDLCVLNRVLPDRNDGEFFARLRKNQSRYVAEAEQSFVPIPIASVPFQETEPLGLERLVQVADALYDGRDPAGKLYDGRPFRMKKRGGRLVVEIAAPFAKVREIHVSQNAEELNVRIGDHLRKVPLPARYADGSDCVAELENDVLTITVSPTR